MRPLLLFCISAMRALASLALVFLAPMFLAPMFLAPMFLAPMPALAEEGSSTWSGLLVKGSHNPYPIPPVKPPYANYLPVYPGPPPGQPVPYTSISASWIQPLVTCTAADPNARVSFWVGLDATTIEQVGTIAICNGTGPPSYGAWWEMYNTSNPHGATEFSVSPGDAISASVTYVSGASGGEFLLTVSDATNQMSFVERKACNVPCPRSTAEWIVERPGPLGNPYPLGDYSPITFTDLQASGIGGKGIQYFMEHKNVTLSSCIASPPFPPRANALTCLWSASQ